MCFFKKHKGIIAGRRRALPDFLYFMGSCTLRGIGMAVLSALQLRASKGPAWPWGRRACPLVAGPACRPSSHTANDPMLFDPCCPGQLARVPRPIFRACLVGVVTEHLAKHLLPAQCRYQATERHFFTLR